MRNSTTIGLRAPLRRNGLGLAGALRAAWAGLAQRLARMRQDAREAEELLALDHREQRDIGVNRYDIARRLDGR